MCTGGAAPGVRTVHEGIAENVPSISETQSANRRKRYATSALGRASRMEENGEKHDPWQQKMGTHDLSACGCGRHLSSGFRSCRIGRASTPLL